MILLLLLAAQARAAALLWVPEEAFSSWKQLDDALRERSGLRLTAALTPAQLPAATPSLKRWAGRLEPAVRLDGDAPVSLVGADLAERAAAAREAFRVALGTAPSGFVAAGGALDAASPAALKSVGFSWVAVGDYGGSTTAWASAGGLLAAPGRAVEAFGAELTAETLTGLGEVVIVDEAAGLAPPGSFLRADGAFSRGAWATVSEAAAKAVSKPASPRSWTGWASAHGGERAGRNRALLAEAAAELRSFQNSGLADLKALDAAAAELYAAQAARFHRDLPAGQAEASDKAFRARLLAAYRKMRRTPPEALFTASASSSTEKSTAVRVTHGGDWLELENPDGSFGRAPPGAAPLTAGAPGELWRIVRLRVEPAGDALLLRYTMGRLEPQDTDLGRLMLETYIDLNGVRNAGSQKLLAEKDATISADDAWEFALSVSARGAYVYRANALGAPQLVQRLPMQVDAKAGEVVVTAPRSVLRGSPLQWGFVVAAYASDGQASAAGPPLPLSAGPGTAILGLIAPLERQRTLAGSQPRLLAVRLKKAAEAPASSSRPKPAWGE